MSKFSNDNPFFEFMGELGDWMILNVLFILTSLPLVTIGMSMTAMYKIALRKRRGESNYIIREYFKACREEWKQSTVLWLILLVSGSVFIFDLIYTRKWGIVFSVAIVILMVIWSFLFSYVFPLQARFQNSIKNTMKNALFLAVKYFPYTLLIAALNLIPVICLLAGARVTMMVTPIYCFIGFGITAKINSILFSRIFDGFIEMSEKEA